MLSKGKGECKKVKQLYSCVEKIFLREDLVQNAIQDIVVWAGDENKNDTENALNTPCVQSDERF